MVRAGVVSHPSQWSFSGYNETEEPRRKNVLVDYERLAGILRAGSYEQLRRSHKEWVEEYLGDGKKGREEEWTGSIAVGNRPFVEKLKALLGFRAKGRKIIRSGKGYQVREAPAGYNEFLGAEKEDIGLENTYSWNLNL